MLKKKIQWFAAYLSLILIHLLCWTSSDRSGMDNELWSLSVSAITTTECYSLMFDLHPRGQTTVDFQTPSFFLQLKTCLISNFSFFPIDSASLSADTAWLVECFWRFLFLLNERAVIPVPDIDKSDVNVEERTWGMLSAGHHVELHISVQTGNWCWL